MDTECTWTTDEDTQLCDAVVRSRGDYEQAAKALDYERTTEECRARGVVVKRRGQWTRLEDDYLRDLVVEVLAQESGSPQWVNIALLIPGRTGKQCRERYKNHLAPGICKMAWTAEEDAKLIELQKLFGNSWCKIAGELPGRAENAVKNRWNGMFNKRVGHLVTNLGTEGQEARRPRARVQHQRLHPDGSATACAASNSAACAASTSAASAAAGMGGMDGARSFNRLGAPDDGFMRSCAPIGDSEAYGQPAHSSSLPGSRRGSATDSLDMALSFDELSLAGMSGDQDSLQLLSLSNLSTDNLTWSADDTHTHMGGGHASQQGAQHETFPVLPPMPSPAPARDGHHLARREPTFGFEKPRTPALSLAAKARAAEAMATAPRTPPQHTCSPSGEGAGEQHSPQHAQAAMQQLQRETHSSIVSAADEARARLRRRISETGVPPSPLSGGGMKRKFMPAHLRPAPLPMPHLPHLPPLEQHSVDGTCSELANRETKRGRSVLRVAGGSLSMQSSIPTISVFSPAAKRRLCPTLTPLSPMASPGAPMLNCEWW